MRDQEVINSMKGLILDGIGKAKSGHPGGAMSSLDFAYILFTEYLNHNPDDPKWQGRDRFILSAGHESMLLYTLLHYQGHLELEELKKFRQLGSKTPGHPENYVTDGIECTTGPLGQGAAMSVGFSIASSHLKAKLDKDLFNQKIWVLMGDGCMQEGIVYSAASTAGHLGLSNLIWYYDKNDVQISGKIDRTFSDDVAKIYEGLGWNVLEVDGHNHSQIRDALDQVQKPQTKPTLIIGTSTMARGAHSLEGSPKTHGSPFPQDELEKTKEKLSISKTPFEYPAEHVEHFRRNFKSLRDNVAKWNESLASKLEKDSSFSKLYKEYFERDSYDNLSQIEWDKSKPLATRAAFGKALEQWSNEIPNLMGGSADLEPSNSTGGFAKSVGDFTKETPENRNIAFGVREFPMAAICNGIALYGAHIPFGATFLTFSDYSRPALRLGAIQKARVIHEFTHDSFYVGEDGPTHQPVEHVMTLRSIPDFYVIRPSDSIETEILMKKALTIQSNSAICLTRQNLPFLPFGKEVLEQATKGAYVLVDHENPDMVIFATGSEVSLALDAAKKLPNYKIKVVAMPCWKLFDEQDAAYKEKVLTPNCKQRVSLEAGITLGWQKYTGMDGLNIGLDEFGHSAPASSLQEKYGFTPDKVAAKIKEHFNLK